MHKFLLTLALASLTASLIAESPPPPPTPTKTAQENHDSRGDNKPNANQSDSPAQVITPSENQPTAQPTATDIHAECTPKSNESSANGWGILNAVLLTLFNGALAWIGWKQYHGMREQIAIAQTSANAAKDSADAANKAIVHAEKTTHLTQRAVVLLEDVVAVPHGDENDYHLLPNSILVFTLRNYGATVAYNVKLVGSVEFADETEKIMELNGDPSASMAPQSAHKWITYSLIAKLTPAEIAKAVMGNNILTYVIDVTYEDVFGKPHKYRDVGNYISPLRGFVSGGSTSD